MSKAKPMKCTSIRNAHQYLLMSIKLANFCGDGSKACTNAEIPVSLIDAASWKDHISV